MSGFGFRQMTRYSQLRAEEGELAKNFHGEVFGVKFDLRHPDIDQEKWGCPSIISGYPGHPGFHIASNLDDKTPTLADISVGDLARMELQRAHDLGKTVVFPGDHVTVERATPLLLGHDRLAPVPESESLTLDLAVTRADGSVEPVPSLTLYPRGNLVGLSDELIRDAPRRLEERLVHLKGAPEEDIARVRAMADGVEAFRSEVEREIWALQDEGAERTGLVGLGRFASPVLRLDLLIGLAALYGYQQGRLEAEHNLKSLAERKLAHQRQAREAGKGNRNMEWADYAQAYWRDHPKATTYAVWKAWHATEAGRDDAQFSFCRSIQTYCPATSKSYKST